MPSLTVDKTSNISTTRTTCYCCYYGLQHLQCRTLPRFRILVSLLHLILILTVAHNLEPIKETGEGHIRGGKSAQFYYITLWFKQRKEKLTAIFWNYGFIQRKDIHFWSEEFGKGYKNDLALVEACSSSDCQSSQKQQPLRL